MKSILKNMVAFIGGFVLAAIIAVTLYGAACIGYGGTYMDNQVNNTVYTVSSKYDEVNDSIESKQNALIKCRNSIYMALVTLKEEF